MQEIRPSPIAGLWYPADPRQLKQEIDQYLNEAVYHPIPGRIAGLMVPHAGYRYSGKTAAYAYQYLIGNPIRTVYLFSPFHDYHPAEFLTPAHTAYETPLGIVPIDSDRIQAINQELAQKTDIIIQTIQKDKEHSLEIQLPFLQVVLEKGFSIVPIMVRSRLPQLCKQMSEIIAAQIDPQESLIIASTDLSHFYQESMAHKLDSVILDTVRNMQAEAVFSSEEQGKGFACGAGALAITLWVCQQIGAQHSEILYYTTSAETTRDSQSVVGYGAAAFHQAL
jgi:MEMO1 family protein